MRDHQQTNSKRSNSKAGQVSGNDEISVQAAMYSMRPRGSGSRNQDALYMSSTERENQEREQYLDKLFKYKPWLQSCIPNLKTSKLQYITKNYPVTEEDMTEYH